MVGSPAALPLARAMPAPARLIASRRPDVRGLELEEAGKPETPARPWVGARLGATDNGLGDPSTRWPWRLLHAARRVTRPSKTTRCATAFALTRSVRPE